MKLEALPAAKGDCLILHHGTASAPKLIVIDGGPSGVYKKSLLPRLRELHDERVAAGLIADSDPLMIDLLVVSHIDDDHINGVKALLNEMQQRAGAPEFIIGRLWHNGFDSLVSAENGDVNEGGVAALPATASVTASLSNVSIDEAERNASHDLAKVLASIGQGHDVVKLAKALGISINPEFGGKAIVASDGQVMNIDGLKVTVVGPLQPELDKLRADFKHWFQERENGKGTPASLIAGFDDISVANLSSIVLLVEEGGERYLLTGDARGDYIMSGITELGLADANGQLALTVLKVQHHGSDRNSTKDFFQFCPAQHYIFSGNGEHGNPERETFSYLADAQGTTPVVVELTYSPALIDAARDADWAKHHKNGPSFDHAKCGIVPFFAAHPTFTIRYP